MLRFPNPGSNLDNLIKIYRELYYELFDFQPFSLDNISRVLATKNLATSSGYIGKEALKRSTRMDRSRDPMYNQSKMYAETYRFLGWIHPTDEGSLSYQFTYFGAHVTQIIEDPKPFMRECLIGIAYPTEVLNVKGGYTLRPFYTILKSMKALGGYMSRDEMIIGPLSLDDDTIEADFESMIHMILGLRKKGIKALNAELGKVTGSTGKVLSQDTRQNNTRFPLAALLWTDWATTERRKDHYGKSQLYYCLTDFGNDFVDSMMTSIDIRMNDLQSTFKDVEENIIRLSFYQLLLRSGFDVTSEKEMMLRDFKKLIKIDKRLDGSITLFSPYQELSSNKLTEYFPSLLPDLQETQAVASELIAKVHDISPNMVNTLQFHIPQNCEAKEQELALLIGLIEKYKNGDDLDTIIQDQVSSLRALAQKDFYPLVAELFQSLEFNCVNPPAGVNYLRWDAIIIDKDSSIPIEIKSPAEELHISMKAIRQALENKIVLLSRGGDAYPTSPEISTLVVGYYLPNNRSEVEGLMQDIQTTYGFHVGVIDLFSLIKLAVLNSLSPDSFDKSILERLNGYLSIETV